MYYQSQSWGQELPTDLRNAIGEELRPGERLLWTGQPEAKRSLMQTLPILLFGIPWTLFSLFWMGAAGLGAWFGGKAVGGFFWMFPLFGLPFVLVGFGMLLSPYWAWRSAKKTAYAVTNERVIVLTGGKTRKVETVTPEDLGHLERTERADGSGDLVYLSTVGRDSDGDRTVDKKTFLGIPDVRRVEQLLRDTFSRAPRPQTEEPTERLADRYKQAQPAPTTSTWWTGQRGG